jgi:hypothetical protein
MAHMESGSLFAARWRWHRTQAACEAATRLEQEDREALGVATEAWLSLVRTRASAVADGDEHLVQATVALAAILIEGARPQLPPAGDTGPQPQLNS